MSWILPITILGALVVYFMSPEERMAALRRCAGLLHRVWCEARRQWIREPDEDGEVAPPLALATWAIVVLNVALFVRTRFSGASFADPATLIAWGGNFGPRTTNGEWWRLIAATFVHGGMIQVLATLAGFVQVASITERAVGPFAFVSVYLAAGALANLVCLSTSAVSVTVGASGAVFGVYGLFVATWIWGLLRRSPVRVSWRTAKRLLPGVGLFLAYAAVTGRLDRAAAAAAGAGGAISGFLLAKGAVDHKPAVRRVGMVAADIAALIVLFAVPLRGMTDARPEVERLVKIEDRATGTYDAAVAKFRRGTIQARSLVWLIDHTILPELQESRTRLAALNHVPAVQQPLVAGADRYLRLRDDSWRLRSEGLRMSRIDLLHEAASREREAREALRNIPVVGPR